MANETTPAAELAALRAELARLSERLAALEAAAAPPPSPRGAGGAGLGPATGGGAAGATDGRGKGQGSEEPVPEEVLLVLAAAAAAFLGKKPRIRSVRILSSPEWGRLGRMHIQASHALARPGR